MPDENRKLTLGEQRVRVEFNPSNVGNVNFIKEKLAELINLVNDFEAKDGEHGRVKSIAMTELESASMWAVKAVTY